jgi:hypothetical protein
MVQQVRGGQAMETAIATEMSRRYEQIGANARQYRD